MELEKLVNDIFIAKTVSDVLGPLDAGRKKRQNDTVKFLHPDRWVAGNIHVATKAFARLQELLAEETKSSEFEIVTKKRVYKVSGLAYQGSVSNLYHCRYARDDKMKDGLLKFPRSVRDSDLMLAEAKTLKAIWDSKDDRRAFFPRFEESFKHRDKTTKIDRTALVVRQLPGFISLAEVKRIFPDGLEVRDLAWIWRRILVAISLLSELDIVHGSIIPEHILIHSELHGVQLTGMTTSVESGQAIKVLGGKRNFFPPEVLNKKPASVATDIYTLHATMAYMLRDDAPKQFRAFIKGCMFERPKVRPHDSLMLLKELDELLERLYGLRKFREFPEIV